MKKRIKRVVISPEALFHIMATGTAWEVKSGIPVGSSIRGFTLDPLTANLNMFVEYYEFPEVELETEIAPQLNLLFKKL